MAQKNASAKDHMLCNWSIFNPLGPTVAYHASCIIDNTLYIHGGVDKLGRKDPLNKLWCTNLDDKIWIEIHDEGSPSLSHHSCVAKEDRFIVLIGGWDGKKRTSAVHVFDVQEKRWSHPTTVGFPEGAGLTSHTATLGANGDILLIGREGSLRTQRRAGNAFLLTGSIGTNQLVYMQFPIGLASRSGHSAHVMKNKLYVIGGRDDNFVEVHTGYKCTEIPNSVMHRLMTQTHRLKCLSKVPGGRRNHVGVCSAGGVLVHGGETFDGRTREPVDEMYLMKVKPAMTWYKVPASSTKRAGHSCDLTKDKVIIHGGHSGKSGLIHGDTYSLEIKIV